MCKKGGKVSILNICLACDDNYAQYAGVVIASVLLNSNKDESFVFYIIAQNLSEKNIVNLFALKNIKNCEIKIITPPEEFFEVCKEVKTLTHITLPSYFRLRVASLLDAEDRVLYLDSDLIVEKSLSDLYFTDFKDNFCAGVVDYLGQEQVMVNSGVLLINLQKWREENAEKLIFNYIEHNKEKISSGDQEIINAVFKDKILLLPDMWNVQTLNFYSFSNYEMNYGIVHFIGGSKPWLFGSFMPFKKKFFYYMSKTEWGCPSLFWQFVSNVYSYLRYLKRVPFFWLRPRFFKALKNGIARGLGFKLKTNLI